MEPVHQYPQQMLVHVDRSNCTRSKPITSRATRIERWIRYDVRQVCQCCSGTRIAHSRPEVVIDLGVAVAVLEVANGNPVTLLVDESRARGNVKDSRPTRVYHWRRVRYGSA